MFNFHWPWLGLLLLVPVLVRLLQPRKQREADRESEGRQSTLLHPSPGHLAGAFAMLRPFSPQSAGLQGVLLTLLWTALVISMMRPQWMEPYSEARTEGYDLMLAIDASRSMAALDFSVEGREVTRMAVIKGVAGRFIAARAGDRIGLVVFGDHAYTLSPLTLDVYAVRSLLDAVVPSIVGDATAMGDAIALATKKLRERPEGSRVLVLVTDGESTAGFLSPTASAQLAAQEGIRIYAIGVGSKGMVPFIENGQRTMVSMEIDENTLKQVAKLTGGAYFRATDADALEEIYARIDSLEKTQAEARSVMIPRPLYHWPLGFAMLVFLLLGFFPDGKRRYLSSFRTHA